MGFKNVLQALSSESSSKARVPYRHANSNLNIAPGIPNTLPPQDLEGVMKLGRVGVSRRMLRQ
jgi:hypothetical protein